MDLSLQSIKTNHWSVDNLKKHVTSMNDTGQWIPGGFLTAVNRQDVHKEVHYQVKHRLYIPWTPS